MGDFSSKVSWWSVYLQRLSTLTDSYHCSFRHQPGPVSKQSRQTRGHLHPRSDASAQVMIFQRGGGRHIKKITPTQSRSAVKPHYLGATPENRLVVVKQRRVKIELWESPMWWFYMVQSSLPTTYQQLSGHDCVVMSLVDMNNSDLN